MAKKIHPLFDKVKDFIHRLTAKCSLKFEGKKAVFTIEIDLTQPVAQQLQGIEHTLVSHIPDTKDVKEYLSNQKEA